MKHKQTGFTLIELVVVITILGILAAFALPRFSGLEKDARIAAVNGVAGSVRAAAALAHSISLVKGKAGSDSVTMEGVSIGMANFYPTSVDIDSALSDTTGFDTATANGEFQLTSAPTPGGCKAAYTEAAAGSSPSVTITTSGC